MNLHLNDKTALVTGSTAGIGLAIASALAAEGASVIVNGRTQARVDAAVAEIQKTWIDADVRGVAADLSTADGVAQLLEREKSVDILVNNLGIFEPKSFADITDQDWTRFFETNVMSGVRLSRAYLPTMQQSHWGRIIFISSESAVNIPAEMIHYGMTKTAQLAVARGLAESLVGTPITVNSVLVGPTRSEGVGTFVKDLARHQGISEEEMEKQFFEKMRPTSLLKRLIEPSEIASAVAFLASEAASVITGSAMRVEGGLLRGIL
jgi:NAD(P)-dependent dehydrogenase (short-subunit alcohol dehydrogenase family)